MLPYLTYFAKFLYYSTMDQLPNAFILNKLYSQLHFLGGIKARPGSLRSLSVLRLGCGLKSIKEQPGWFFAIFRKFLGRVLFFDKTQPAM